MSAAQLFYLLGHMQRLVLQAPDVARSILMENPQLTYALLHAQFIAGMIDEPFLPLSAEDLRRSDQVRMEREAQVMALTGESRAYDSGKVNNPRCTFSTDTIMSNRLESGVMSNRLDNVLSGRPDESQNLSRAYMHDPAGGISMSSDAAASHGNDQDVQSQDVLIEHLRQNEGVIQQIMSVDPDNVDGWNEAERAQIRQIQMELRKRGLM